MATFDKRIYQTWRITGKDLPLGPSTFDDEITATARRDELLRAGHSDVRIKAFKSVKWRVRIRLCGAPEFSRHFSTREKAEEWARALEGEIVKREAIDYRAADQHSLSDLLGMYEEKCLAGRGGDDPDRVRIRKLREHPVGQWRMSSLTAKAIADYRDQRLRVVKGSTVKKEIELISRVIAKARKEWGIHLPANVASGTLVARPEGHYDGKLRQQDLKAALEKKYGFVHANVVRQFGGTGETLYGAMAAMTDGNVSYARINPAGCETSGSGPALEPTRANGRCHWAMVTESSGMGTRRDLVDSHTLAVTSHDTLMRSLKLEQAARDNFGKAQNAAQDKRVEPGAPRL